MTQRMRNRLIEILMLFALGAVGALIMPRGYAAMIPTEAAQPAVQIEAERERVKALLSRPEVVQQLGDLGVAPADAAARVDAMTDAEVIQLAGKIDRLVAGGAMTNDQLIIILLLILILVLVL